MLIVDLPISKPYWEPFYKFILRQFSRCCYVRLKRRPIYRMMWNGRLLYVAAKWVGNTINVIGWLYLQQKKQWKAWEIEQAYIFDAWRGQGWGTKLYNAVINTERLILVSGRQQTKTGRAIWRSMVASKRYEIWAHDLKNLARRCGVEYDKENDELYSELQLYQDWRTELLPLKRDVRLIAIRKKA